MLQRTERAPFPYFFPWSTIYDIIGRLEGPDQLVLQYTERVYPFLSLKHSIASTYRKGTVISNGMEMS